MVGGVESNNAWFRGLELVKTAIRNDQNCQKQAKISKNGGNRPGFHLRLLLSMETLENVEMSKKCYFSPRKYQKYGFVSESKKSRRGNLGKLGRAISAQYRCVHRWNAIKKGLISSNPFCNWISADSLSLQIHVLARGFDYYWAQGGKIPRGYPPLSDGFLDHCEHNDSGSLWRTTDIHLNRKSEKTLPRLHG